VPDKGIDGEKDGDEESEKSDDLVSRQGRAANELDNTVREDPAGEAADGEQNGGEIGGAVGRFGSEQFGLWIGGQDGGTVCGVRSG
jgi:hypothetical protein